MWLHLRNQLLIHSGDLRLKIIALNDILYFGSSFLARSLTVCGVRRQTCKCNAREAEVVATNRDHHEVVFVLNNSRLGEASDIFCGIASACHH